MGLASTIISSIEFTFVAAVLLLHECWECLVEMVAGLAELPRYQPVYEIQQDLSICSEATCSRFDTGNRLYWDVQFYLKLIQFSFIKLYIGKSTSILFTVWIPALVVGIKWQNGCQLTNRVTDICGAAHFSQSASMLQSGNTGLALNFGQSVI